MYQGDPAAGGALESSPVDIYGHPGSLLSCIWVAHPKHIPKILRTELRDSSYSSPILATVRAMQGLTQVPLQRL